jgi:uncharacterized lipoprotein YmbA
MTCNTPSRRGVLAGAALLPVLASCAATPSAKFFTLAPRPATQSSRSNTVVMVRSVELPKYLDRPEILRRGGAYDLKFSQYERWGEGMGDMVTRVLVENLSMRMPACQVYAASGPLTLRAGATVELEMSRFDADPDGTVILAARWTVQRDGRTGRLRSERIEARAASPETAQLVSAMSDALGQLGDRIALDLAA